MSAEQERIRAHHAGAIRELEALAKSEEICISCAIVIRKLETAARVNLEDLKRKGIA